VLENMNKQLNSITSASLRFSFFFCVFDFVNFLFFHGIRALEEQKINESKKAEKRK